jgi:pimeloyl-ACP methyl ester carboxylesterase
VNIRIIRALTLLACIAGAGVAAESQPHVCVIHGFGSNAWVMSGLVRELERNGYEVTNWGYASVSRSIPELGELLYREIRERADIDAISFVTHSMGGLIVRSMYSHARGDPEFPPFGRIVMLSPPNRGAQIADFFSQSKLLCWALGPNLENMRTDSASLANQLPDLEELDVGIVMGVRYDADGWNMFIEGDDDGFLTPDKARLGTEDDFITVRENHFFMPQNADVHRYILRFLQNGHFDSSRSALLTP